MKTSLILFLMSSIVAAQPDATPPSDLSIPQAIRMAELASPDFKAALERERAAEQNIRISQSLYYPTFNIEAVDTYGFPGSSRDLGVSGLMGSPFRSGPAAGMTGNLELFDAGRTYAVQTAQRQLEAVRAGTQIIRYQVDQQTLQIFLDASRFRGQEQASHAVVDEIARVEKEVNHFVATGQRSVVEKLLVHDQTIDAEMTASSFRARYAVALERLAVVTASTPTTLSCPDPQRLSEAELGLSQSVHESPLVLQAMAQAAVAHSQMDQASAQNYPKLLATASVGDMDESRVVSKKEYSGGFGFQMPLFEGNRIEASIRQAQALASARDNDQLAVRMDIEQISAHYDEIIESSRVKLGYLRDELQMAQKAVKLAKERYFSFQGTLVDVREALRNLARVQSEVIDIKIDLLLAAGSKALVNGGHLVSTGKG